MKTIITIPAYNEEKSLKEVLESIKAVMNKTDYAYQLLVVNDGSTDNTAKIAKEAGATVVSHAKNLGLATTFRTEIKTCLSLDASIIVHTDADGQYHAEDIPKLLAAIKSGNDLVLGSRFQGTIEWMPKLKRFGNKAFSYIISKVSNQRITDGQTGFRAFTRKVAEDIDIISNFTYTQEQVIRAIKQGFRVVEVPVYFAKRDGKSKLMRSPFHYAISAWVNLIRLYRDFDPLKFFVRIGIILISISFVIGFYFIYLHFTSGINGHLGLLMLMLLLFVAGFQTVIFGFLADMNRKV
ncbi:MAG: glycosyltransferase family 2 protein [Nanoarchaeota archaeon]